MYDSSVTRVPRDRDSGKMGTSKSLNPIVCVQQYRQGLILHQCGPWKKKIGMVCTGEK